VIIRAIEARDVEAVVAMVHELAAHEEMPEECHLEPAQLHRALFGERPALFGIVADDAGEVGGFALYFLNFSTWDGVHGIYLEDLYVTPEQRGTGLGFALLVELARECVRNGYSRLQWAVLDWNTPSIEFYEKLGAKPLSDWITYRLSGDALRELGNRQTDG
jgi:GNAT superfamily N-acetyltransferase